MHNYLNNYDLGQKETIVYQEDPFWFKETGQTKTRRIFHILDSGVQKLHCLPYSGHVLIGRGADAAIQLSCERISRRHACVYIGDQVELEDLGSLNGSIVSGTRLKRGERINMQHGDAALFGSSVLVLKNILFGTKNPTVVTKENLINGFFTTSNEQLIIAILSFTFTHHFGGDLLSTLIANVFGSMVRMADWGNQTWKVACIFPDVKSAERSQQFAISRLAYVGYQANVDLDCFPLSNKESKRNLQSVLFTQKKQSGIASASVTQSKQMARLFTMIEKVAISDLSILILGETGVGKEIIASMVHEHSHRNKKQFLQLNCANLTESLFESELFGHEGGAFTGAKQQKIGLLELANGGTVFLDEVAELPLSVQAKLLRIVELQQFMRVGGTRLIPINVRFVSATNCNLLNATKNGKFREDLYFRLAGIVLRVPPLRDRPEDIPSLARTFLNSDHVSQAQSFSINAIKKLYSHDWPGNIRELRNVVIRSQLLCDGKEIEAHHVIFDGEAMIQLEAKNEYILNVEERIEYKFPFGDPDKANLLMKEALEKSNGNQTTAAKILGISRRALVNRLEEFGFPRPRIPDGHS